MYIYMTHACMPSANQAEVMYYKRFHAHLCTLYTSRYVLTKSPICMYTYISMHTCMHAHIRTICHY